MWHYNCLWTVTGIYILFSRKKAITKLHLTKTQDSEDQSSVERHSERRTLFVRSQTWFFWSEDAATNQRGWQFPSSATFYLLWTSDQLTPPSQLLKPTEQVSSELIGRFAPWPRLPPPSGGRGCWCCKLLISACRAQLLRARGQCLKNQWLPQTHEH